MKRIVLSLVPSVAVAVSMAQTVYPEALKEDTVDEYFGVGVADPYRWLENDTSARTAAWVAAENEVTAAYMRKIPFRGKLLARLKSLADYEKIGAPAKKFGRYYFNRNDGLQNQYVLYVCDSLGGEARVFLDPNRLSDDGTVALKGTSFSHDGKYFAYSVSRSGSDWSELYVKDVETGELLDDHIEWVKFSGAQWYGNGFYYSSYDAPEDGKEFSDVNEVHKVYYHKIGTPQSEDVLFYMNPVCPRRFYSVRVNREETVMFLNESGEGAGNRLYVRDLRVPGSQFIQMTDDMESRYSVVSVMGDSILILTNYGAPKYRLMVAGIRKPGIGDWRELVPECDDVLDGAAVIGGRLLLTYSKDASDHAFVYSADGTMLHEVSLPSVGSVRFVGDKDDKECFYTFSSYTTPGRVYRYDIDSDVSVLHEEPKVNFKPGDYVTEQVFYTSKDGTRVPMSIMYRKGMRRNGRNPVLLYGYGGFNISMTPSFSAMRIPFLERGGIYAVANLRGGGEYGEEWHLAGTKMRKQNVFDDFIAAAEYLIENKYTGKDRIAIVGGSNGGLLVGACMTQRPDLFRVAVPEVGVMDMLRYHRFTIGWNWASDYGTSGDSKEMFEYLRGYSPLHNLKPGTRYPATLVTTADHDDRVVPAHSFKFAATLQECHAGDSPVLIRIDSKAGHGSGKPMSKVLEEQADIYSFIMYNLGMKF